ncbi:CRISPR-associated helicase/endonuclease Cas3 [Paenibacillus sp. FSL H7-0326]|uniref:CRISPR-associated helicase/endonuclease Cas3 n=1 Tax=Paenibacillus sp. FSL H7-0326 TaxID=1921144 RepID=UPI00096E4DA3|nr:CRISPR-associated helicase/endonuclease Cas3 [Paenibacillus sp. FSL H7-0326]OMC72263.1 CRISPR-associated helicase/endonuclease Cas3 [Paenibacillus sp. FSL H7-0326]
MNFIAHIRERDQAQQRVESHLLEVKKLAESIGSKIGVAHIAGLAGLLHDMGKFTDRFRTYILEAVQNPDHPPKRGSVDHSTAGGKLLYELYHQEGRQLNTALLAEIVGNAIISHHSYLQDYLDANLESRFLDRVRDKELLEYEQAKKAFFEIVMRKEEFSKYVSQAAKELDQFMAQEASYALETKLMFLTKFIFSALIDADRTNTRLFEEGIENEQINEVERSSLFFSYYDLLMKKIESFRTESNNNPVNLLRRQMSEQCEMFADKPSGIYTLSIPTGGGKTLASLRYALRHALNYDKKRIIYILPYTTIIEQNTAEIRQILMDDENILEHHSNIIEDSNDDDELEDGLINKRQKWKLAKDNWDSPIIFSTMVQFLNVIYAKGSRNIRRFHNLSESIIIFDEVQKVPVSCVSLFNQALNFMKTYCSTSIVLCTATQPALHYVENKLEVNPDGEIIDNLNEVISAFKRVEIIDKATNITMNNNQLSEFVTEKMEELNSVLIILNTKTVAKRLYTQLISDRREDVSIYHLSTSMCAAHRKDVLNKVRTHLKNKERVVCISTQLIEAGVDVSFECVIRSLAGLDSIAQAAGRCNRHGEYGVRQVYVIDHMEEKLDKLPEIKAGKQITKWILIDMLKDPSAHGGQLLSTEAMKRYFEELYGHFRSDLNYRLPQLGPDITISRLLTAARKNSPFFHDYATRHQTALPLYLANSYNTAAAHFEVIDNMTTSVIVPYGQEGKDIIADLNGDTQIGDLTRLLRKSQQYTIQLFHHELQILARNEGLKSLLDGKVLILSESAYDEEYGLNLQNESNLELNFY